MRANLDRRIAALEATLSPAGPVIGFWAMNENCEPMTEREIEEGIAAIKADHPPNARIVRISWLSPIDAA